RATASPASASTTPESAGVSPASASASPESAVSPEVAPGDAIDVAAVADLLDGKWATQRRNARDRALDEAFHRPAEMGMDERRERVAHQLQLLSERGEVWRGFPEEYGGKLDPGGNLSNFEELFLTDPSLQIKGGVQWGLFGSAVQNLGSTEQH